MAKEPMTAEAPRVPLTRERVMRAALELADSRGLESVTMRQLGSALGVEAMSLYNHVRNKDDLLDGLVDLVYGEVQLPEEGEDWKAAMRRRAISTRDVLSRHPWAIGLIESRTNPGPATMRHHDAVIGSLRTGGFSIGMAAHAFSLLDSYLYGWALQQRNLPFRSPEENYELAELILQQVPANEFPYLAEMITDHAMQPGFDYTNEFEYGLNLILDGLDRARDVAPARRAGAGRH